jgi:hypothetical protein
MPDPTITEPVPFEDWFLLSLWGLAVLGLMFAWKWEFHGAVFTIAIMFIRELAWVIIKGGWIVAFLLFWLFIIPPAVMYIMAWRMERKLEVE